MWLPSADRRSLINSANVGRFFLNNGNLCAQLADGTAVTVDSGRHEEMLAALELLDSKLKDETLYTFLHALEQLAGMAEDDSLHAPIRNLCRLLRKMGAAIEEMEDLDGKPAWHKFTFVLIERDPLDTSCINDKFYIQYKHEFKTCWNWSVLHNTWVPAKARSYSLFDTMQEAEDVLARIPGPPNHKTGEPSPTHFKSWPVANFDPH